MFSCFFSKNVNFEENIKAEKTKNEKLLQRKQFLESNNNKLRYLLLRWVYNTFYSVNKKQSVILHWESIIQVSRRNSLFELWAVLAAGCEACLSRRTDLSPKTGVWKDSKWVAESEVYFGECKEKETYFITYFQRKMEFDETECRSRASDRDIIFRKDWKDPQRVHKVSL